tara:strand:+ start:5608 stop:5877 length:270 start_codon:yes stop_codon:yes gene_type:complete
MTYGQLFNEAATAYDSLKLASYVYEDMKQFYYDEEAGLVYEDVPYDYFIAEIIDDLEELYGWETEEQNKFLRYIEELVPDEFKELLFIK